jgi:hypothetical protein
LSLPIWQMGSCGAAINLNSHPTTHSRSWPLRCLIVALLDVRRTTKSCLKLRGGLKGLTDVYRRAASSGSAAAIAECEREKRLIAQNDDLVLFAHRLAVPDGFERQCSVTVGSQQCVAIFLLDWIRIDTEHLLRCRQIHRGRVHYLHREQTRNGQMVIIRSIKSPGFKEMPAGQIYQALACGRPSVFPVPLAFH